MPAPSCQDKTGVKVNSLSWENTVSVFWSCSYTVPFSKLIHVLFKRRNKKGGGNRRKLQGLFGLKLDRLLVSFKFSLADIHPEPSNLSDYSVTLWSGFIYFLWDIYIGNLVVLSSFYRQWREAGLFVRIQIFVNSLKHKLQMFYMFFKVFSIDLAIDYSLVYNAAILIFPFFYFIEGNCWSPIISFKKTL